MTTIRRNGGFKLVLGGLAILVLGFLLASLAIAETKAPGQPGKRSPAKTPSPMDKDQPQPQNKEEAGDDAYDEDAKRAGNIREMEEEAPPVLDKEIIRGVIDKQQAAIKFCYEKELKTNQKLAGRLLVNFLIGLDGKVANAKKINDKATIKDDKVIACVLDTIKKLQFPTRKSGEPMEINFPFNFQPKKE